ncbi:MAG: hypothetical protein AAFX87_09265 [Bacteroidota bacterium]
MKEQQPDKRESKYEPLLGGSPLLDNPFKDPEKDFLANPFENSTLKTVSVGAHFQTIEDNSAVQQDNWVKDEGGNLYFNTAQEANSRMKKLQKNPEWTEYRVVSFKAGDGKKYWRVEMRGKLGVDINGDNVREYVFKESDGNAFQVWQKLKDTGKTNMSWNEFLALNDGVKFNRLKNGSILKYRHIGGAEKRRENVNELNSNAPTKTKAGSEIAGDVKSKKTILIAWSFDDGPVPKTDVLHDRIKLNNVTWFIVKSNMLRKNGGWKENVKRYQEFQKSGGEIGIHAQHEDIDHIVWFPASEGTKYPTYPSVQQAMKEVRAFKKKLNDDEIYPKFVRLPGGLASQLEYYAIHFGFKGPDIRLVRNGILNGRSFEEIAPKLSKKYGQLDSLKLGYATIAKDYQHFKSSLKNMNLLLWGGSSDPNKISAVSWNTESSGDLSLNDTVTGHVSYLNQREKGYMKYAAKFEKMADEIKEGETRSLVILAHDTSDIHINEILEDKKRMEEYAAKPDVKVRIEYVTMSTLFNRITNENVETFTPKY